MGFLDYAAVTGISAAITSTGVGVPILGAMGFGSGGVVAGTWASIAQSYIGDVTAQSFFALAKSMAALAGPWSPGFDKNIVPHLDGQVSYFEPFACISNACIPLCAKYERKTLVEMVCDNLNDANK